MSLTRYSQDSRYGGGRLGTAKATVKLRNFIKAGLITPIRTVTLSGAERLDTLAGSIYGDGRHWWVLAAASGIGWGMQVPPGTLINVLDLRDVERLVG